MAEAPGTGRGAFRFGIFELDSHSGELRKAGVLVGLQEQSLKVLVELLDRPGELVTREQLRQRLWPDGTYVDFDHGLNAVINRLRGAGRFGGLAALHPDGAAAGLPLHCTRRERSSRPGGSRPGGR